MSDFPLEPPGYLRWQCRRSCLELDILLNDFLDAPHGYAALDDNERQHLGQLLSQPDDVLLAWLIGEATCPDGALRPLVQKIRDAQQDLR